MDLPSLLSVSLELFFRLAPDCRKGASGISLFPLPASPHFPGRLPPLAIRWKRKDFKEHGRIREETGVFSHLIQPGADLTRIISEFDRISE
jgi:hypothetical protein